MAGSRPCRFPLGIATSSTAGSFLLATGGTGRKTSAGYRGSRLSPWMAKDGDRGREELNCERRAGQSALGGKQYVGTRAFPRETQVWRRLLVEERLGPDRMRHRTLFAESRSLLLLPGETHGPSKAVEGEVNAMNAGPLGTSRADWVTVCQGRDPYCDTTC